MQVLKTTVQRVSLNACPQTEDLRIPDEEQAWMLVAKDTMITPDGQYVVIVCTWSPPPPGKGFQPFGPPPGGQG
jgi:hypothetical protein